MEVVVWENARWARSSRPPHIGVRGEVVELALGAVDVSGPHSTPGTAPADRTLHGFIDDIRFHAPDHVTPFPNELPPLNACLSPSSMPLSLLIPHILSLFKRARQCFRGGFPHPFGGSVPTLRHLRIVIYQGVCHLQQCSLPKRRS